MSTPPPTEAGLYQREQLLEIWEKQLGLLQQQIQNFDENQLKLIINNQQQ